MIYKSGFFRREVEQFYTSSETGKLRRPMYGLFLGLLTFAIHFLLRTMVETVFEETFPHLMQPSFFSVAYTFTIVSLGFFTVYFIAHYNLLTFAEIQDNRWYILTKMGYHPSYLIFAKLSACYLFVIAYYTSGYLIATGLTFFLKYSFVFDYLVPVYLAGLIDILCIVSITMTASIFIKDRRNARYFILGSLLLFILTRLFSKYYDIISDRVLMQNIRNMFDFSRSIYLPVAFIIIGVSSFACIFGARVVSKYYFVPSLQKENVVVKSYLTQRFHKMRTDNLSVVGEFMNKVVGAAIWLIILATIAFNGLVLVISASTPGKEIAVLGYIPYVFKSETMRPAIYKNDLVFFTKLDEYTPNEGDIVLYQYENEIYVQKVIEVQGDKCVVDLLYYPQNTKPGSMERTIENKIVYGLYASKSRWLGALIVFANTTVGRFLLLLLPAVLVFFYKQIMSFIRKISSTTEVIT